MPAIRHDSAALGGAHVLHVVTYNVKFGQHIDRAINVLSTRAPLTGADIVLLQEMDAEGARRIADALGMWWVYYPAAVHPKAARQDFGNAVLSRWPIVADEKLMLPHIAGQRHAQRTATAATVLVGTVKVRVYGTHLGTLSDISTAKRRDQADAIIADAATYPFVIVAGDMNNHGIGKEFVAGGFQWPTEHNGFTTAVFNWDHIFLKGFSAPELGGPKVTGIVRDTLGTSDHDPVWAVARFP
jgi:endonuclease/exonuclease/phosphatase family metal-dependent hydrolase